MKIWFYGALLGATLLAGGSARADENNVRVFLDLSESGYTFKSEPRQQRGPGQISYPGIACLGYEQAIEAPFNPNYGSGSGSGRVRFGPVVIRKAFDSATPTLMQILMTGRHLRKAKFHFVTQLPTGAIQELDTVEIEDVVISSIKKMVNDPGGPSRTSPLVEEVTFNFGKLTSPVATAMQPSSAPPPIVDSRPSRNPLSIPSIRKRLGF